MNNHSFSAKKSRFGGRAPVWPFPVPLTPFTQLGAVRISTRLVPPFPPPGLPVQPGSSVSAPSSGSGAQPSAATSLPGSDSQPGGSAPGPPSDFDLDTCYATFVQADKAAKEMRDQLDKQSRNLIRLSKRLEEVDDRTLAIEREKVIG